MDKTSSVSCPMVGFGISGVEPSGCATRELVTCTLKFIQLFNRLATFNID